MLGDQTEEGDLRPRLHLRHTRGQPIEQLGEHTHAVASLLPDPSPEPPEFRDVDQPGRDRVIEQATDLVAREHGSCVTERSRRSGHRNAVDPGDVVGLKIDRSMNGGSRYPENSWSSDGGLEDVVDGAEPPHPERGSVARDRDRVTGKAQRRQTLLEAGGAASEAVHASVRLLRQPSPSEPGQGVVAQSDGVRLSGCEVALLSRGQPNEIVEISHGHIQARGRDIGFWARFVSFYDIRRTQNTVG